MNLSGKLLIFAPTADKNIVVYGRVPGRQHYKVFCTCRRKRKDGISCKHTAAVLANLRPWYRARTTVANADPARVPGQ